MSKAHGAVAGAKMTFHHTVWGIASVTGATGVGLGAFGAHALKGLLGPSQVALWQTASQYHLLHAVVLVALAAALSIHAAPYSALTSLCVIGWAAGTLLFSGSLYALALGAPKMLGVVTPLGGVLLILGWVLVGVLGMTGSFSTPRL